jgi:tetratricopeptide (TPR) repeat protein
MHARTALLLALLAIVAGGGLLFHQRQQTAATTPWPPANPVTAHVNAPDRPRHARVADDAAILAPFVPRLGRMADAFYKDLGIDVRVATTTQAASSIEEQATAMFERQQIGREAAVGGLLILLNPRLHSARIEVGYTLEGALTDLHMSRIARDQLAPYASYGVAGMAVMDVLHYLRDHVYLSAALGRLNLPEDLRNTRAYLDYEQFVSGGAGARTALANSPNDLDFKKPVPREQRARYAPSSEVEDSVDAYLRASANLVGDPTLELFTEGSRLMRSYYPMAPFEEARRLETLQASLPLQYIVQGDYAVATSKRPARGFVPVLLHREDGLWRIDLVETWKNLFFDADGNYFLRNSNTPYGFALKQFGSGQYFSMGAVPLRDVALSRWLQALDRDDVIASMWRAELWLRNGFVAPQALLDYERALRLAPRDPWVLETFGERARYLGFPELAIPALEAIGHGVEMSLADACNEAGDPQGARHWVEQALARNPYDLHALRWQRYLAERAGGQDEVRRLDAALAKLMQDPERPYQPVMLFFEPQLPRFEADTPIVVDGTTVFDHSKFGVTIQNTSNRPVVIDSVQLTSTGNAAASGLGDIKNYWHYLQSGSPLGAGQYLYFDKQWGFTQDTEHRHVRYVFHTCWHGVDSDVRQCRTQWVDTMPYIPNPQ